MVRMAYLCDYVQLYGGISTIMFWVVHDHVVCDDHVAALPYADACSLSARCLRWQQLYPGCMLRPHLVRRYRWQQSLAVHGLHSSCKELDGVLASHADAGGCQNVRDLLVCHLQRWTL